MSRTRHQILPGKSTDLGRFLSSSGPQKVLRSMHLPRSSRPYSPDKASRNPISKVLGGFSKGLYGFIKSTSDL